MCAARLLLQIVVALGFAAGAAVGTTHGQAIYPSQIAAALIVIAMFSQLALAVAPGAPSGPPAGPRHPQPSHPANPTPVTPTSPRPAPTKAVTA